MNEIIVNTTEFKDRLQKYEQFLKAENKSADYISGHKKHLEEFLRYAEENTVTSLKGIDQALVNSYVLHLETERIKRYGGLLEERTVAKHKNSIRNFWKYLTKEEVPVCTIRVRHVKKKENEMPEVLTHEEIKQLYSVCDDTAIGYRDRAMLAIYYGCGLRRSEGVRLQVSDINFAMERLHVRKSKNNRERYVMMSPKVKQQIEEYVHSYRDFYLPEQSDYEQLFIGERGTPVIGETLKKRIEALWLRVKDRYGSEKIVGCHTLRHSLGTHLYMAKMDIEMIALMLGHRTLEATQLYIHSANMLKK